MRITKLWITRSWLNRLSYWFYDHFCREPYFPDGKIVILGDGFGRAKRVCWRPKKFIPGIHEYWLDKNEIDI